ncbi:coenzyme PQQ synthesis protein E [Methylopila jiangsuensis]|uniref:PqqA peptide cyclase n=2 Tax=Methylopila jiangsuensis TaxID=586230 RepID=A0A9W6JG09_9HYPH|nr:pyrroloquinoline quinone biosynthesis protein E [Methylopila jiangsuensis]GLK75344.1 coenzyme PQQ synthesis protein E [Methylopila jiangsuensis]
MNDMTVPNAATATRVPPPAPLGMLAELTHRCPLSCPYCSNPVDLDKRSTELDTETWKRVFSEAAAMGVLHLHLSGGEPTARKDIVELTAHAVKVGLYTNLITSGIGVTREKLQELADAGLDHVQLSIQDALPDNADRIAGLKGAHEKKRVLAAHVLDLGLPLTINAVIHRANIENIEALVNMALEFGARRVEVAHSQYYGWALENRNMLMPTREQVMKAAETVERLREQLQGKLVIDAVVPDYYARRPKPCVGGWGKQSLNVTPQGKVLPCHAAETITHLQFDYVTEKSLSEIWTNGSAFEAYRGTSWMKEPCTSCPRKEIDFGGCRCQALAITGDPANADPACSLSPFHAKITSLALKAAQSGRDKYVYRSFGGVEGRPKVQITRSNSAPSAG